MCSVIIPTILRLSTEIMYGMDIRLIYGVLSSKISGKATSVGLAGYTFLLPKEQSPLSRNEQQIRIHREDKPYSIFLKPMRRQRTSIRLHLPRLYKLESAACLGVFDSLIHSRNLRLIVLQAQQRATTHCLWRL